METMRKLSQFVDGLSSVSAEHNLSELAALYESAPSDHSC